MKSRRHRIRRGLVAAALLAAGFVYARIVAAAQRRPL